MRCYYFETFLFHQKTEIFVNAKTGKGQCHKHSHSVVFSLGSTCLIYSQNVFLRSIKFLPFYAFKNRSLWQIAEDEESSKFV